MNEITHIVYINSKSRKPTPRHHIDSRSIHHFLLLQANLFHLHICDTSRFPSCLLPAVIAEYKQMYSILFWRMIKNTSSETGNVFVLGLVGLYMQSSTLRPHLMMIYNI